MFFSHLFAGCRVLADDCGADPIRFRDVPRVSNSLIVALHLRKKSRPRPGLKRRARIGRPGYRPLDRENGWPRKQKPPAR
jgi:hypothetical protein